MHNPASGVCMKKLNLGNRSRSRRDISGATESVPINGVVDYLQNAIVNFQLFGLGTGAIVSLALLVSLFSHWANPCAQKGVL
jgi:hypothetical protein